MRLRRSEIVQVGGERPDGGAAYQGFQDAGADVRRRGTTGAKSVTKGGERPAGYAASHLQRDIIRGRIYPDHVMATANHFIVGPSPQKNALPAIKLRHTLLIAWRVDDNTLENDMFKPSVGKEELKAIIEQMSECDVSRFLYCQEMAGTYLAVGKFENTLISAMHMCDRVKLEESLGQDQRAWERSMEKKAQLEGSTIGSLIKILERHDIDKRDIQYLRWIKNKRDYFVHRLFHDGPWPGDLDEESCRFMRRRLLAIQFWLERAERRIWLIFERADFINITRLENGSLIVMNAEIWDAIPKTLSEGTQN